MRPANRTTSAIPSGCSRLLVGRSVVIERRTTTVTRRHHRFQTVWRNQGGWRVVIPSDRMPPALAMTDEKNESGAPVAKDAIDPELIRLGRTRPKVGLVT